MTVNDNLSDFCIQRIQLLECMERWHSFVAGKSEIFQETQNRLILRFFGAETPPSVWSRSTVTLKEDIIQRYGIILIYIQQESYLRKAKVCQGGV